MSETDVKNVEKVMGFQAMLQNPISTLPEPTFNFLALIATTILVDTYHCRSGSEQFIRKTRNLKSLKTLEFPASEARLLLWYELNKDMLLEKIKTSGFKHWFYSVLDSFEDISEKMQILNLMQDIAMSGKHPNVNSLSLLTLAERHWRG